MRSNPRAPGRALIVLAMALAATGVAAAPAAAVTGGADADAGDLPFVAHLSIGTTERACSGTLVHPQLVLTAKACFGSNPANGAPQLPTTVTVGRADLNATGGARVAVRDLVVHPGRNLALARLDVPVTSVAPAVIADAAPREGDTLTIAGFGRTADAWIQTRLKAAQVTVGAAGDGVFDIGPAEGGAGNVCAGDAGGPALRVSGSAIRLIGVHHTANQAGCLGGPAGTPSATETRIDDVRSWITGNFPAFRSGFESNDPRLNWHNYVGTEPSEGNIANVGGIAGLPGPELFRGVDSRAHGGEGVVLYSGKDNNATRSFAYTRAYKLGNVQVRPASVLSYWIYPQSKDNSHGYADGTNSTCVAIDLLYSDNTTLRDSGALDQRGNRAHPGNQCNKMPLDEWTQVVVPLAHAAGKRIVNVSVGYDQGPGTGGYRGFVDDVQITDIVRFDRFSSGVDSGDPDLNWRNTVSASAPGGGLLNVGGVCCGLTGPELFVGSDSRAHSGTQVVLYSGRDNNGTKSYAYTKAFGPADAFVTADTRLSYWIYPQSKDNSHGYADGNNSTCVGVDLMLTDRLDGTVKSLRDAGVRDQRGNSAHPGGQCDKLRLDAWNYVSVPLGPVANGKQVTQIDIGYDQGVNTGGYRGFVDDIRISE